ncbi:hypothetical protein D3C78_1190870 [compost metagenome]
MLLLGEHVHGAALAFRQAAPAAGQLGHDATRAHAQSEHVAVVTVSGDDLIAFLLRHLHANNNGFLTDVEVTETADEAHTIKLAGLFFETADKKHFTIGVKLFFLREVRAVLAGKFGCSLCRCLAAGYGRWFSRRHSSLPELPFEWIEWRVPYARKCHAAML